MEKLQKIRCKNLRIFLSDQLKNEVIRSKIDQKQIAFDLGIDPSNLSRILNVRYSYGVDMLLSICDKLHLKIIVLPDACWF